ncbi:hypothetical protein [Pedobacter sp. SYSU D00535]|uniref:hypothetical protein n=1 Tax=Pedobacter sp. SYSU D00535 TaxID=2810308 RepID=UPI001A963791|nr:hypothetical protein [Pedobacter sp. SYSU D00535]
MGCSTRPVDGIYTDKEEIENIFKVAVANHFEQFDRFIAPLDARTTFRHWREVIRSVDEWINLQFELPDPKLFLTLPIKGTKGETLNEFVKVLTQVDEYFGKEVGFRFSMLADNTETLLDRYVAKGLLKTLGDGITLADSNSASCYYQTRRQAYAGMLNLIPARAKGQRKIQRVDLLYHCTECIDICLVGYGQAYFHLLVNECLNDYEITVTGDLLKSNYVHQNLEGFYLEPERLSLLDQLELRAAQIGDMPAIIKPRGKVFSFNELDVTMAIFRTAFQKYDVGQLPEYMEINQLFFSLARFCDDGYDIEMDEDELDQIQAGLKKLKLKLRGTTYQELMNDYAPFTIFEGKAYSTVPLLQRFASRTLNHALTRKRSFIINSGFVFEDKVQKILEKHGYHYEGHKRIARQEFDLIMTKNGKVYNFQCKNNRANTARAGFNYKLIARYNRSLIYYYRKAIKNEVDREHSIAEKTGIHDITNFVVSRFPVITRDFHIINFTDLEEWISKQNH